MKLRMLRSMAICALAGCTSVATAKRAPEIAPLTASAIIVTSAAPTSSCEAASCALDCANGSAAACTRAADQASDTTESRTHYEKACEKNEPVACTRLIELAGADHASAIKYASRACGAGDATSCQFVSEFSLLAFAAPRPREDPSDLLSLSLQGAERGCDLGNYESCFNAVTLLKHQNADKKTVRLAAQKGLILARSACSEQRLAACATLAEWADAAKDQETARFAYVGLCEADRRSADTKQPKAIESCKRAVALGAAPAVAVSQSTHETHEAHLVPPRALEPLRVAGTPHIAPPPTEVDRIPSKQSAAASFKVCINADGHIASTSLLRPSPLPRWNRLLFEAIRAWDFRPLELGGQPTAACTAVTFVFNKPETSRKKHATTNTDLEPLTIRPWQHSCNCVH